MQRSGRFVYLGVSRNFIRTFLTTILFFVTSYLFGQADFSLDSSRKALDSLYTDLSNLSKAIDKRGIGLPISAGHFKWLINNYEKDSTAIAFYTDSGHLLFRKVNRYNKEKCRWWETAEVYDSLGRLVYEEAWKRSCLKASEKTDPEVKYFDALLYEKQRFRYDSLGRLLERVWWHSSVGGVRKYNYVYDNNNKQTYTLAKHEEGLFWD